MYFGSIDLPDHWSTQGFVAWVAGFLAALYGASRRWCHLVGIVAAALVLLVGICNAEAFPQVPGRIPIPIPGSTPDSTLALLNRVVLSPCSRIVAVLILRDLPSDWYTRSQPGSTLHGVHSKKPDQIIM
jgi:hypothetical protein